MLDLLIIVLKRKWLVLAITVFAGVLLFGFESLIGKPSGTQPEVHTTSVEALLTVSSPGRSGAQSSGLAVSTALIKALLKSSAIKNEIAKKFDFLSHYGLAGNPETVSRGIIDKSLTAKFDASASILTISYSHSDTEPAFAGNVLDYTLLLLEQSLRSLAAGSFDESAALLRSSLAEAVAEYRGARRALIDFSLLHGIVSIEPGSQTPKVRAEYLDLQTEVDFRQSLYLSTRRNVETILLEQQGSLPKFQVLARAQTMESKVGVTRKNLTILGTMAAFFLAVLLSFLIEYFENLRLDPLESRKLDQIQKLLRLRKQ